MYALKIPVRGGFRVSVVDVLPDILHKKAEIRSITDSDRRQGVEHLITLFERPPERVIFPNRVNRK